MSAIYEHAAWMWREMHADWQGVHEAEFDAAEDHCNGYMVSRKARSAGVTNRELWQRPRAYQLKHGSEELVAWLEEHPRTTLEAFELQWLRGRPLF